MNYRHAFHAGNFADVFKHVILARVLTHLANKETAFRAIDTHAGAGRYDLASDEAGRTGEWRNGIGLLLEQSPPAGIAKLLAPYLAAVQAARGDRAPGFYPGSPLVARSLARPQDRLVLCELHPDERQALAATIGRDRRITILEVDGWTSLKAQLPPPERRGLVLIDPPFEEGDDYRRFEQGLQEAYRRWTTGIYLFWYPIKDVLEVDAFTRRVARFGIPKILRVELTVAPFATERLAACGMLLVNPPWKLDSELGQLMPWLSKALGQDGTGRYRLGWLTGEAP